MHQKDTTGISIEHVEHHYQVFARKKLHTVYFEMFVTVPEDFVYKWVQVVVKPGPREKDGVVSAGIDTFYDPYRLQTFFKGSDYPFYYNLADDSPQYSQPPEIKFYDRPQTEEKDMDWSAQTSLFATVRLSKHPSWIWLGTFVWGYKVVNHSLPDTIPFQRIYSGIWPMTQFMIDSLTKPEKFKRQ